MTEARYCNYQHYIHEGWAKEPKQFFIALRDLLTCAESPSNASCLDVGCATGELISFLSGNFVKYSFVGMDIFPALIAKAQTLLPQHRFIEESILSLPSQMSRQFDIVTVMGVMSIFDEDELGRFWQNVFKALKPGGSAYVLSPLNEYGVDTIIKHRKRVGYVMGEWERGWNIYSMDTIKEILAQYGCEYSFKKFQINMDISPKEDPVRTWTIQTNSNPRQLMNGLKLLIDHYFIKVTKLYP